MARDPGSGDVISGYGRRKPKTFRRFDPTLDFGGQRQILPTACAPPFIVDWEDVLELCACGKAAARQFGSRRTGVGRSNHRFPIVVEYPPQTSITLMPASAALRRSMPMSSLRAQ